MVLYSELKAYEEVPKALANLRASGHKLAVLSNASPKILKRAIEAAGIEKYFLVFLSVDVLKCYKPTPAVYRRVTERFKCSPNDVTFFSSNNWDVSGAEAFGFKTIWVNRTGVSCHKPPVKPNHIVRSISEASNYIGSAVRLDSVGQRVLNIVTPQYLTLKESLRLCRQTNLIVIRKKKMASGTCPAEFPPI